MGHAVDCGGAYGPLQYAYIMIVTTILKRLHKAFAMCLLTLLFIVTLLQNDAIHVSYSRRLLRHDRRRGFLMCDCLQTRLH